MLEILLELVSAVGDFFVMYRRKGSDFLKGCLYDILCVLCGVGAALCWNWEVYIPAGILIVLGIVMLILGFRHSRACIKKRQQKREDTASDKAAKE